MTREVTPEIRPIQPSDDAAVKKLVQDTLEEFNLKKPGTAYYDPELLHLAEHYATTPTARYWVLTVAGEVKGGVGIFPINEKVCEVQKLYLLPDMRGRGWGSKLLQLALDFAAEHYEEVYLDTRSELADAILLYKKFGFVELVAAPEYSAHKFMDHWFIKDLSGKKW